MRPITMVTTLRWRSATFFDEEVAEEFIDDDGDTYLDYEFEDDDIFSDLIALADDGSEAQFMVNQEMPGVMEESEAVELMGESLEEIFYETQHRLYGGHGGKGKGKAKEKARWHFPHFWSWSPRLWTWRRLPGASTTLAGHSQCKRI